MKPAYSLYECAGSSPHTRGARSRSGASAAGTGIIPAYAGSTPNAAPRTPTSPDHPRIRGEHPSNTLRSLSGTGSSPHTRGAPIRRHRGVRHRRIIPAYAGSTFVTRFLASILADHPRIRGEHSAAGAPRGSHQGSSPHTRGALHRRVLRQHDMRIIPAYAGSTGPGAPCCPWSPDHPRIRGEHPRDPRGPVQGLRIIPAYAGSTLPRGAPAAEWWDHPRIRGEHRAADLRAAGAAGSSPHTRGAHLEIPAIPRIAVVIIPVFLYPSPTPQEEADRSMVLLTLS